MISTIASFFTITRQDFLNGEVIKTQSILKELKALSYSLVDAETACRAYFITSDSLQLGEYVSSIEETHKGYRQLREVIEIRDDKVYFSRLVAERFSLLDSGIYHKLVEDKVPLDIILKGNMAMGRVKQHIAAVEDQQRIKLEKEIRLLKRHSDACKIFILSLGLVAIVLTIVYRKRLNTSNFKNDRQGAIINAIPANIAILNKDGNITSVNDRWIAFGQENGFQKENYGIGENYLHVTAMATDSDTRNVAEGINSVIDGRESYFFAEYECGSPEKERWFKMMLVPLQGRKIPEYIVMHIDITEVKIAEKEVRQKEQKLRTIAVINSHEIRKPLANILGLLDVIDSVSPDDQQEIITLIKESAVQLDEKVKAIATVAN